MDRRNFLKITGGSLIAVPAMTMLNGCGSGSPTPIQYADLAIAAVDAAIAGWGSDIQPPYSTYIQATLDALNFSIVEINSGTKTPLQLATDITNEFKNVIVPDLTALTPSQRDLVNAISTAVTVFLQEYSVLTQPVTPAKVTKTDLYKPGFFERMEWNHRLSKIKKLKESKHLISYSTWVPYSFSGFAYGLDYMAGGKYRTFRGV